MNSISRLILVTLFFFSQSAFASTSYPLSWGCAGQVGKWCPDTTGLGPAYDTPAAACASFSTLYGAPTTSTGSPYYVSISSGQFMRNDCKYVVGHGIANWAAQVKICPYGGTPGTSLCNNAPPCASGQQRDPSTGQCLIPPPPCVPGAEGQPAPTCGCAEGLENRGGVCQKPNPCEASKGQTPSGSGWTAVQLPGGLFLWGDGPMPTKTCINGCEVTLSATKMSNSNSQGWNWTGWPENTGKQCAPNQPAPPNVTEDPKINEDPRYGCVSRGLAFGTVNGVVVCHAPPPDTNTVTNTRNTTADPNTGINTETTTNRVTDASAGTVTTTTRNTSTNTNTNIKTEITTTRVYNSNTQTTTETIQTREIAPDGSVTRDTTATNTSQGAGPTGGGSGQGGGVGGDCEGPDCGPSHAGGDCSNPSGFNCRGDAIQCAIAKRVFEHRCLTYWQEQDNPVSSLVNRNNLLGDVTDQQAAQALNQDGMGDPDIAEIFREKRQDWITFAEQCIDHIDFEFKGNTYSFNLAFMCEMGIFIRVIIHIVAYMTLMRAFTRNF